MGQATHVQRSAVDTYADADHPSRPHPDMKKLRLQSGAALAYLHFNRPFPLGATIVSATLLVYTSGAWNIAPTLTVKRINEHRAIAQLTWNNRPGVASASATKTQSPNADADEWAIDVGSLLQSAGR